MLAVEPGAGGATLTPLGRPVMNAHRLPPFFAPAPTLFPLPDSLNLAYDISRGVSVLGDFLSALRVEKPGKNSFLTTKAGMSMKTKRTSTMCPLKNGHFLSIRPQLSDMLAECTPPGAVRTGFRGFWSHECRILPPPNESAPAAGPWLVGQRHAENAHGAERKRPTATLPLLGTVLIWVVTPASSRHRSRQDGGATPNKDSTRCSPHLHCMENLRYDDRLRSGSGTAWYRVSTVAGGGGEAS